MYPALLTVAMDEKPQPDAFNAFKVGHWDIFKAMTAACYTILYYLRSKFSKHKIPAKDCYYF